MYEYFVTAFKVIAGVVTNERLAIASLVALGLLFIWVVLSLVFSFQKRFSKHARLINEFVGKNGLGKETKDGLDELVKNMPSEFQREFSLYEESQGDLPSKFIKRFESLDVELSGGVFNQNKSIIKTYINFIFVSLLLLSIAILGNEATLTGYLLAEAAIVPLGFLLLAKIMYYVYTAIRQYQYRVAVDEFNDMLDNLDLAHKTANHVTEVNQEKEEKVTTINVNVEEIYDKLRVYLDDYTTKILEKVKTEPKKLPENVYAAEVKEAAPIMPRVEKTASEPQSEKKETAVETAKETKVKETKPVEKKETVLEKLDEEPSEVKEPAAKRGRGRPKKEVNQTGEFVIKNDKDFEEALLRAEKLMRKNEQPLSASQTKRIEKQIKELVDAMTRYKETK